MSENHNQKSILLVAANPKKTISLRLQQEEREIKERLRFSGYGSVPINSTGATRVRDLQQAMLDFKPQVVHFSGHGAKEEGLVFEDANGQEKLVEAGPLARLFRLFSEGTSTRPPVECIVLNACYSNYQAKAISEHIEYVIGMSRAISDRAAIEFSVGFYNALGAGESIDFAYEMGCIAIQLEGITEHLTPVLFKQGELIHFQSDGSEQIHEDSNRNCRLEEATLPVTSDEDSLLARLILSFLEQYSQWFFNSARIAGWGSERSGYEEFKEYSKSEIDQCLQSLHAANILRIKTSKKGTTLYAIK